MSEFKLKILATTIASIAAFILIINAENIMIKYAIIVIWAIYAAWVFFGDG